MAEPWLRGAVPGVGPLVMPAVHALMQAREEIEPAASGLTAAALWATPGGAASVGFHLTHIARSIDRLLTYARGDTLGPRQFDALSGEGTPGPADAGALARDARAAIDRAIAEIGATPADRLHDPRTVGRQALPTTVWGLLFHIAEHTQRHVGQVITLAKVVRGGAR